MNHRDRVTSIIARGSPDRCGFWLGEPHADTWPIYLKAFGMPDQEHLRLHFEDDMRWISPQWSAYKHPQGRPIFDFQPKSKELGAPGYFAECEDVREVEAYPWPDPDFLDFSETLEVLRQAGDVYRASGFWCPFFHEAADFFGMQNYFIKMYTHPAVVHAVTRHIIDFYLEANRRFFSAAGELVDGFFFGNDFGTQQDLFISPKHFHEFVAPYFRELVEEGHAYGKQVILHSCGSIYRVIPYLVDMGVDALHPLQARAHRMEAERLAKEFKGKIAFIGGIDTQDLLVNGTPQQVREDVLRVKDLLGPHLVISPSHEAILPNVPPENVLAMAQAACST